MSNNVTKSNKKNPNLKQRKEQRKIEKRKDGKTIVTYTRELEYENKKKKANKQNKSQNNNKQAVKAEKSENFIQEFARKNLKTSAAIVLGLGILGLNA